MTAALAADTSVAVPLLVESHPLHAATTNWRDGRPLRLAGHAVAETYSVLTRLPGDLRTGPVLVAELMLDMFEAPLVLSAALAERIPHELAGRGVAGGAVYDALVGLVAAEHGARLATRDARALVTYRAVGADVEMVAPMP